MKRMLLGIVVLVLTACATQTGTQVTQQHSTQFERGKTTEAQIVAAMGKPTTRMAMSDGTIMLIYAGTHTDINGATFIPVIGLFAGGARTQNSSVVYRLTDGKLDGVTYQQTDVKSGPALR
jgi:hypothetical protein